MAPPLQVLDVIEALFEAIFNGLATDYGASRPSTPATQHCASKMLATPRPTPVPALRSNTLCRSLHAPAFPPALVCPCSSAARELSVISAQYPFEVPSFKRLRLTFPEGIALLQQARAERAGVFSSWSALP
jgi:hypothetical protein